MSQFIGLESCKSWHKIQASNLVNKQIVIQIDATSTTEEACLKLIQHNISSIPLYDQKSHSYLGLFDLNDLLKHITLCLENNHFLPPSSHNSNSLLSQSLTHNDPLSDSSSSSTQPPNNDSSFLNKSVLKLTDISTVDPFYAILPETTLAQILDIFSSKIHRVAVMGDSSKITGILSQSTLIKYLVNSLSDFKIKLDASIDNNFPIHSDPELSKLLNTSLLDLNLAYKTTWAAYPDTPITSALNTLEKNSFSSIPILDPSGSIITSLSLSDIKYLVLPKFRHLINRSCLELVQSVRYQQGIQTGKDSAPVISAHPEDPLKVVISKLAATSTHRIWILFSNNSKLPPKNLPSDFSSLNAPIVNILNANNSHKRLSRSSIVDGSLCGVVSLTDIIATISKLTNSPKKYSIDYSSMD
ncbi:Protein SDS23 [Smittium culicis]|uniref:Protein SDS23 n=1 Tax=Smittium culicis TaxID=133412 RepID=A0A1R1YEJ0_9FUNG|nr:Protein SDS23 [Smittium culicis]OMJ25106.1 Protein SDS23 [Smittium culicis]